MKYLFGLAAMLMAPVKTEEKPISKAEKDAVSEAEDANALNQDLSDATILHVEQLAATYIAAVGVENAAPDAVKVFKAAQKAGRIDSDGNFVGMGGITDPMAALAESLDLDDDDDEGRGDD